MQYSPHERHIQNHFHMLMPIYSMLVSLLASGSDPTEQKCDDGLVLSTIVICIFECHRFFVALAEHGKFRACASTSASVTCVLYNYCQNGEQVSKTVYTTLSARQSWSTRQLACSSICTSNPSLFPSCTFEP